MSADELTRRKRGMPRFSVEMPRALLARVDDAAKVNLRSRNAELRILVNEALDAREKNSSPDA